LYSKIELKELNKKLEPLGQKVCAGCFDKLKINNDNFSKNAVYAGGYSVKCRVCIYNNMTNNRKSKEEFYKKNPELKPKTGVYSEVSKAKYKKRNENLRFERSLKKADITKEQYEEIFTLQKSKCAFCLRPQSKSKHKSKVIRFSIINVNENKKSLVCFKCYPKINIYIYNKNKSKLKKINEKIETFISL
jgi:hypothetical protein